MMKLLLAVIATCALVVSPTCIKIKHQLRSNAPTIHVLISNGNTQMTSQVARDGSHRFTTDNLSNMTLAPAGTQTVTLSYDEIFPITDAAVCTEVHPLSAGGCADGVCCKISISMYTITDAIIMTARVNNKNADGNPQFWKCEQEIQVPGVTNTEPTGEEIAAEILHGEDAGEIGEPCGTCGNHASCTLSVGTRRRTCECDRGYVNADGINCDECTSDGDCHHNAECKQEAAGCQQGVCPFLCSCKTGYGGDVTECADIDECTTNTTLTCHGDAQCANTGGSYTCTCNSGFYGNGDTTSTGCTACETCVPGPPVIATYCSLYADSPTNACCETCTPKKVHSTNCGEDIQCLSNHCYDAPDGSCLACNADTAPSPRCYVDGYNLGDFTCEAGVNGYCFHNEP